MAAFGPGATICDTLTFLNLLLILLGVLYFSFAREKRISTQPGEELLQANASGPVVDVEKPQAAPRATVRSAHLDNLKVFLTVLVVTHHVACTFSFGAAFTYNISISRGPVSPLMGYSVDNGFASVFAPWFLGVNQSYFMCLFFLISGFFTPSSLDRKGRQAFLKDKFLRLGIPLLAYYLIYGPLMSYLEGVAFAGAEVAGKGWWAAYKGTWFMGGPPWFILWLLNFNVIYAFSDGAPLVVSAPSSAMVFAAAFFVGMIQYVVPSTNFVQVPMGLNQLVVNVLFFSAGVLAKRGAWMEKLAELDAGTVWFLRFFAVVLMGVFLVIYVDIHPLVAKDPTRIATAPNMDLQPFFSGVGSVIFSVVQLQLFQSCFGGCNKLLKWASSAAYTVYLIHPPFVVFGAFAYARMLEACGMTVKQLLLLPSGAPATTPGYIIETEQVGFLWLGFLFTSFAICGVLLWPVAWALAKLPGFRRVL